MYVPLERTTGLALNAAWREEIAYVGSMQRRLCGFKGLLDGEKEMEGDRSVNLDLRR